MDKQQTKQAFINRGFAASRFDGDRFDLSGEVIYNSMLEEGMDLSGADLRGVDLTSMTASGVNFEGADFTGADIRFMTLADCNLKDAIGLPDAPVVENIDAAILSIIDSGKGKLDMNVWHDPYCETTHCRAGWAVTLAGPAGRKLEERYGVPTAGALIYNTSRPGTPIPNWFVTDREAIADMEMYASKGK